MPAAYTHTFIARQMLERIAVAILRTPPGQVVPVEVPAVDGGAPRTSRIPYRTASLLVRHPASFLFGATAPDFFVDVVTGITTSHQPSTRGDTLAGFLALFAQSADEGREEQIAFLLGWLAHYCADVFGHHWVGNEAGGAFLTWIDKRPEGPGIIRKHIGIEMTWDEMVHETQGDAHLRHAILAEFGRRIDGPLTDQIGFLAPLVYERDLVERAMLREDSPLCWKHYDFAGDGGELAQIALPMIRLNAAAPWHGKRAKELERFRERLGNPLVAKAIALVPLPKVPPGRLPAALEAPCRLCKAHGVVSECIERACPVCLGIGVVERAARGICLCGSANGPRVQCPKCQGFGFSSSAAPVCTTCGGSGRMACKVCGGKGQLARTVLGKRLSVRCPGCAGQGNMPCPHVAAGRVEDVMRDTCPVCHGEREVPQIDVGLFKVPLCPYCVALKTGAEFARERCPQCKGARKTRENLDVACPVCKARQAARAVLSDPKFQMIDLIRAIVDRLAAYHWSRKRRIENLTSAYLRALEQLGFLLATKASRGHVDVARCFKDFLDQLGSFWISQLTFSDLVPELAAYGDAVSKAVEDTLAGLLDLVPASIREAAARLTREAVEKAIKAISERIDLPLTESEKRKVRSNAIGKYPVAHFPPVADAVQLFALALDGAEPTREGIVRAAEILEQADNIDSMSQPGRVRPARDQAFPWDSHFRLYKKSREGEEALIRIGL